MNVGYTFFQPVGNLSSSFSTVYDSGISQVGLATDKLIVDDVICELVGCSEDSGEIIVPCPMGVERSDFADICVCVQCELLPGIGELLVNC